MLELAAAPTVLKSELKLIKIPDEFDVAVHDVDANVAGIELIE